VGVIFNSGMVSWEEQDTEWGNRKLVCGECIPPLLPPQL
jgi:hypothetical protein